MFYVYKVVKKFDGRYIFVNSETAQLWSLNFKCTMQRKQRFIALFKDFNT